MDLSPLSLREADWGVLLGDKELELRGPGPERGQKWWASPGSTAHWKREMGVNQIQYTGNLARNFSFGGRIKPQRHMCVNEQCLQKQVLPNVEHLCELVNRNNELKRKELFMDCQKISTLYSV